MARKVLNTLVVAAVALTLPVAGAIAQDWPSDTIRIVNPNAPGGATDNIVRAYAQELSQNLGVPVIVENIAGATGAIGTRAVMNAAPDGYTLLWSSVANFAMTPHIRDVGYDALADLEIVARPTDLLLGLGVPTALGVETMEEYVALAQSAPGEFNFGSAGVGSASHLRGELFNQHAGTSLTHVPYSGGGPALVDLLGGRIQALFDPSVLAQQESGVTVLAVIGSASHPAYPDLPLMTDYFPDYELPGWQAIFTPVGVDPAIKDRIRQAVAEINTSGVIAETLLTVNAQGLTDDLDRDIEADLVNASELFARLVEELDLAE